MKFQLLLLGRVLGHTKHCTLHDWGSNYLTQADLENDVSMCLELPTECIIKCSFASVCPQSIIVSLSFADGGYYLFPECPVAAAVKLLTLNATEQEDEDITVSLLNWWWAAITLSLNSEPYTHIHMHACWLSLYVYTCGHVETLISGLLNGPILFCTLSSVVVCNARGQSAATRPGAWLIQRPTLHNMTVRLRPVRATPCVRQ